MSSMKDRATDEEGLPGPDSRDDDGGREGGPRSPAGR